MHTRPRFKPVSFSPIFIAASGSISRSRNENSVRKENLLLVLDSFSGMLECAQSTRARENSRILFFCPRFSARPFTILELLGLIKTLSTVAFFESAMVMQYSTEYILENLRITEKQKHAYTSEN